MCQTGGLPGHASGGSPTRSPGAPDPGFLPWALGRLNRREPFKSCFQGIPAVWGSGCDPHWFSRLNVWGGGLSLRCRSLKVGCLDRGFTPPQLLREKAWVLSSLSRVGPPTQGGVPGKTVAQPLLPAKQESQPMFLGFFCFRFCFQRKLFPT